MTTIPLPEYPRPQLVRESYLSLNGTWNYAFVPASELPGSWDGDILVPYSPEAALSGVNRRLLPDQDLWYRREIALPDGFLEDRVLLHFGAVDQDCIVLIDGEVVGEHSGGYLPFALDVTAALADGAVHELTVRVRDITDTGFRTRGKQALKPGGIWYTPQSGIWQSVWLESVPVDHVRALDLRPSLANSALTVTVDSAAAAITVIVSADGVEVARAHGRGGETLSIPIPEVRAWSPEEPFLYDLAIETPTETVRSYAGIRDVAVAPDARGVPRLMLNGRPYLHAGVLDQGYWPDGLYTPPSDAAFIDDIARMKDLGFTMLRKHIKIEPLRWYYHADRLGMLVWQDMVNGGRRHNPLIVTVPVAVPYRLSDRHHRLFGRQDEAGRAEFLAETDATIAHLRNVPSIVTWVPFNEAWGQFDAAAVAQRVAALDPDRVIDHASGWQDQGAGHLRSLHIYFQKIRAKRSWGTDGRAVVVSEYGGFSLPIADHTFSTREFGYRRYRTIAELTAAFERLHRDEVAPAIDAGLSGFVYTQLSDVEDELNGLVTYDRAVPKIDPAAVRAVNRDLAARFAAATDPERNRS